ncbi:hypothetical protein MAGCAS_179 [Candidatus Hodgkinia cicadicola]|uniref:Uncharacterized protein n=1 Tax=Candidatus Hodgkinia cicadicola TaxID=573658 RepID=A0ABX4MEQ8_9HYPH|nr:hypothetical protein MAGCAS_179 [Candidatus Hodgkinia cicadicola]PIM96493.1 hypothetical protein magtcs_234 [Candidatus Hodgkinia cicadicola]
MKYWTNKISSLNYNSEWLKTKLRNNVVLSSMYLDNLNTIVDKIELSVFSNCVVLGVCLNRCITKDIILKWYVRSTTDGIELLSFKSKIRGLIYEIFIDKYEFMKIRLNNLLYVGIFESSGIIINFDTKNLFKCLHETKVISSTMVINQVNLQQNLKYNLDNKVKDYVNQVNIVDDLTEQHEMMKKRLLIEVNMPKLIMKRWKIDINW